MSFQKIVDLEAGSHIYSNVKTLKRSRRLAKGEIQLKFDIGTLVTAIAVGDLELILPSWLVIELSSVYYLSCASKKYYIYFLFGFSWF
jgi:hypothetical protein